MTTKMKVCTVEFKPSFTSKLFIIILEKHLLYFHFRCRNRPFPISLTRGRTLILGHKKIDKLNLTHSLNNAKGPVLSIILAKFREV